MKNENQKAKELLLAKGYTVTKEKTAEAKTFGTRTAIDYLNGNKPFELACIVYSNESYSQEYPLESRIYLFNQDNKVFNPNALGYSLFANSLDNTDMGVRLEAYEWEATAVYILEKN